MAMQVKPRLDYKASLQDLDFTEDNQKASAKQTCHNFVNFSQMKKL